MRERKQIGVIIASEWWESFAAMKDKDVAVLVRAMIAWQKGDEDVPPLTPVAAAIWPLMKAQQERNSESYSRTCEKRREAALKRWEKDKKEQDDAKECKCMDLHKNEKQNGTSGIQTNYNLNPNHNVSNDTVKKSKPKEKIIEEWLKRCIGRFYRRRKTTEWSGKELKALTGIIKRDGVLAECRDIMALYNTGYEYFRKDVVTLLSNWSGEVDKARKRGPVTAAGGTRSANAEYGF